MAEQLLPAAGFTRSLRLSTLLELILTLSHGAVEIALWGNNPCIHAKGLASIETVNIRNIFLFSSSFQVLNK